MNTNKISNATNQRPTMHGKPVIMRDAKTVLNTKAEAFEEKGLCGGSTFNPGDSCVSSCSYCYVGPGSRKYLHKTLAGATHEEVVIRRKDALLLLQKQLTNAKGLSRYTDPNDNRIVYSSTLVDVAAINDSIIIWIRVA